MTTIDYIDHAFCPVVLALYTCIGLWLFASGIKNRRPLLFLLGAWSFINAIQIVDPLIRYYFQYLPYIGNYFQGDTSSKTGANIFVLCLSFGSTICLGWAGTLAILRKTKIYTGDFLGVIGAFAAIVTIASTGTMSLRHQIDTATTLLAILLIIAGIIRNRQFIPHSRKFSSALWIAVTFWLFHAFIEAFWYPAIWYIAVHDLIKSSEGAHLFLNIIGVAPTIGAIIITGYMFRTLRVDQFASRDIISPSVSTMDSTWNSL